ncbi:MAG: glucosaminidase domain-containing protein [Stellaceae bacterium]
MSTNHEHIPKKKAIIEPHRTERHPIVVASKPGSTTRDKAMGAGKRDGHQTSLGPGGGGWTNDGGASGGDVNIRPAAAPMNPVQARKERFGDAHLADAQKAADKLGIPVENILGLSALESNWGISRFASQGNNFFGIHYPAPYATGYLQAKRGSNKVATFASYADSLKSFIALSGSLIEDKSDPEAFAAALQNSGKFGSTQIPGRRCRPMSAVSLRPFAGFAQSSRGGNYEVGIPIHPSCPRADRHRAALASPRRRSRNEDPLEDRRADR